MVSRRVWDAEGWGATGQAHALVLPWTILDSELLACLCSHPVGRVPAVSEAAVRMPGVRDRECQQSQYCMCRLLSLLALPLLLSVLEHQLSQPDFPPPVLVTLLPPCGPSLQKGLCLHLSRSGDMTANMAHNLGTQEGTHILQGRGLGDHQGGQSTHLPRPLGPQSKIHQDLMHPAQEISSFLPKSSRPLEFQATECKIF